MKPSFRPLLSLAALSLGFIALGTDAGANPILAGNIMGIFQSDGRANTWIENSSDGSASFRSGLATSGSFQSGVSFTGNPVTDMDTADVINAGSFTYYNGVTRLGTASSNAALDLYLQLNEPTMSWLHLATLNFGIDATVNTPGNWAPDKFTVSYSVPEELLIGTERFNVAISGLPAMTTVAENSRVDVGALTLTLVPTVAVPDGGASILFFALGLLAILGYSSDLSRRGAGFAR